jgi:outer membrane protein assembly factor BamB
VLALLALAACAVGYRWLRSMPELRSFPAPQKTRWVPDGPRRAGPGDYAVIPEPDTFHTMHVGVNNTDEVWSVAAPQVRYEWTAEPELYVPEGPTFDNEGNLYFSPVSPREDVSLVSLERASGRRRWSIPGRGAGCGAPLILNDPDRPGSQIVYHSTYTTAMALRPDGSVIWRLPTGLAAPARRPGERDMTHVWGMNHQRQADAVVGVTMDGWVFALDRRTGAPLLRAPVRLPGAPAVVAARPPAWVSGPANRATDAAFGQTEDGLSLFTTIFDVIFGSGVNVANYYGIDPGSGRLYVAATAPDEQDGAADGVSHNGALYLLELRGERAGGYALEIVRSFVFEGGTGSTPTIRVDGGLVVVSDDNGNVIALDAELRERWRLDVGSQVAASIAVSSDGGEMYAVTKSDILKLRDRGDSAEIVWRARLDAYPGFDNFNALTPTITANGVVVSIGAGRRIAGQQLMLRVGMGLLDRETGLLRSFAEGREESIAVSAVGPDGGLYLAGSPVRRAVARGILGDWVPPLAGGIQRYRPIRLDLLVRDAACAAAARAMAWRRFDAGDPDAVRDDVAQIRVLLRQGRGALPEAAASGDLGADTSAQISGLFDAAQAELASAGVAGAESALARACGLFE